MDCVPLAVIKLGYIKIQQSEEHAYQKNNDRVAVVKGGLRQSDYDNGRVGKGKGR
jgi:hypothetical protein